MGGRIRTQYIYTYIQMPLCMCIICIQMLYVCILYVHIINIHKGICTYKCLYVCILYVQMPLCMYIICMCVYIQMPRGLLDEGAELLLIDLRGNVGGYFPAGVQTKLHCTKLNQAMSAVTFPQVLPAPRGSLLHIFIWIWYIHTYTYICIYMHI